MSVPTPTLETRRLRLRPFSDEDADALYAVQSDPQVLEFWDSPPWTDRSMVARYMAGNRRLAEEGTGARVAVERQDDRAFLGWITVNSWNPDFRSASLGFCFGQDHWGRGYATEAASALVAWAFDTFDLNRIQAEADTRNHASRRVLEKLGFQLEGTLREDCIVGGVVSDSWVFGLLRREWLT